MKLSVATEMIWQQAAFEAMAAGFDEIEPDHFFLAFLKFSEVDSDELQRSQLSPVEKQELLELGGVLRQWLASAHIDARQARRQLRERLGQGKKAVAVHELRRSAAARRLCETAVEQARGTTELQAIRLLQALIQQPTPAMLEVLGRAGKPLPSLEPAGAHKAVPPEILPAAAPAPQEKPQQRLSELTERLRTLRKSLAERIFGQPHAIDAFVEGMFNAEVVASADLDRRRPQAVFIFAGPPGVGKTMLAEQGASALKRPFRRFDMSGFAGHHQADSLVGMARSYRDAHPGQLTEFVEQNPQAILLFDEVEKAHLNTIQLFLQILDAGILEDKYHERMASFRDTVIIFTTNAGRKLYDTPNSAGVYRSSAAFHRGTILDALANEKDPRSGENVFPEAICSRLAAGYPVMFNRLGLPELERVVEAEVKRVTGLMTAQYGVPIGWDELLPLCLLLREGGRADARTLASQAGLFLKGELFKFCKLFEPERLDGALQRLKSIRFRVESGQWPVEMVQLLTPDERPQVLLVAERALADLYREHIRDIDWHVATTKEDALAVIANQDVQLLLLDLWVGGKQPLSSRTIRHFDHTPAAARVLDLGQEILRGVHQSDPGMPVCLLSLQQFGDIDSGGSVDEELLQACVHGGGARGVIATGFLDGLVPNWKEDRDKLAGDVRHWCERLKRERAGARLQQERKVLSFDTAPLIDPEVNELVIRARNLRFSTALAAADASEVIDEVDRPRTHFADVFGADAAKEELKFFVDYLRNPREFRHRGIRAPKGVLLHGPPGTGKTMLARALAGESQAAFMAVNASSFVTIWQGSGPQNVRDLFARARRYAPSIIFIDEIDAIGQTRTGGAGGERSAENTLNALLSEMDGFTGPSSDRPVFVLAATNVEVHGADEGSSRARQLDPALVRRFSRSILVDLPQRQAREQYLQYRLAHQPACAVNSAAIQLLAERSAGLSISNLDAIIEAAVREAMRKQRDLTGELLEEALEKHQYGERRPHSPEMQRRTAIHEAGHAVLYWLSGWIPSYVTIVGRGRHGGYMAPDPAEQEATPYATREDLLASIRVCLGGRAAEMLVYGAENGLTTGASSDLERATYLATSMICRFGMEDGYGPAAFPDRANARQSLSPEVESGIRQILKQQMVETVSRLERHRPVFDRLCASLRESERLSSTELREILPKTT